jgi:hypothetical protein
MDNPYKSPETHSALNQKEKPNEGRHVVTNVALLVGFFSFVVLSIVGWFSGAERTLIAIAFGLVVALALLIIRFIFRN